MKTFSLICSLVCISLPVASSAQEILSAKQIRRAMDGKIFNLTPRDAAIWSATWAFDFGAKESRLLASPRGTAKFGLNIVNDQLCNSRVPAGPMSRLNGCFDVIRKGKALNLNQGNRKRFILRVKGVVQ